MWTTSLFSTTRRCGLEVWRAVCFLIFHYGYYADNLHSYVSMDYILLRILKCRGKDIKTFFITYDIACQFSKNFFKRMEKYNAPVRLDRPSTRVQFLIPKFHLPAHGNKCQEDYSLNYTPGVGRTCGEGIEASWANTNGAALSTREMGPLARHEALDDLFNAINWSKTLSLGMLLCILYAKQILSWLCRFMASERSQASRCQAETPTRNSLRARVRYSLRCDSELEGDALRLGRKPSVSKSVP
jgi:hypothetical protein